MGAARCVTAIVFGLLDRETGKVQTSVVSGRRKGHLRREIRKQVAAGTELNTDALKSYEGRTEYTHNVVDTPRVRQWDCRH